MNSKKDVAKVVSKAKRDVAALRRSLGLEGPKQQNLLRQVRSALGWKNAQIAEALGVSTPTLNAYLAPDTAKRFRPIPEASRMLLQRILAEHRTKRPRTHG